MTVEYHKLSIQSNKLEIQSKIKNIISLMFQKCNGHTGTGKLVFCDNGKDEKNFGFN